MRGCTVCRAARVNLMKLRTLQLLRLVYTAAEHEMRTRQALAVLDWSSKLLSATASELCSRNLLTSEKGVLLVPREIIEKLERGEGIPIAPGKVFYARAGGPTVDRSAFTALRAERLPLSDAEVEAEIERLKALPPAEFEAQREPAASRLGGETLGPGSPSFCEGGGGVRPFRSRPRQ